ncbi:MAG: prepilin-type N-terminal cleavage/methylation domain-containing protein [Kiritimatiellae bacterium]|nr:prepilin-type N-terminal cleavage/methylation domain-containing protein [Kiritimatiellia bacterium]
MPRLPARPRRPRSAFTLIELMIVVAIIGILAALMAGAIGYVQDLARRNSCLNNLRQWGGATSLYLDEHRSRTFPTYKKGDGASDADLWWNALPPYLEEGVKAPFTCVCDSALGEESEVDADYRSYAVNPWVHDSRNTTPRTTRLRDSQLAFPSLFVYMYEGTVNTGTNSVPELEENQTGQENVALYADLRRHGRSTNALFADGHAAAVVINAADQTTLMNPNKDLKGNDL